VVTTRIPRERTPVLQDAAPRVRTQAAPQSRYVIPPTRRTEDARAVSRPPFGVNVGPERKPEPRPPRYEELRKSPPPPVTTRSQATTREQATERRAVQPATRPVQPSTPAPSAGRPAAPAVQVPARPPATPPRGEVQREERARPLPGHPASQTYRGRDVRETR
jgi:hypothetical protein